MTNTSSTDQVPGLLDEARLSGVFGVRRELGPRNVAHFVAEGESTKALAAIGNACQSWGGGAFPLIPVSVNSMTSNLSPFWEEFVVRFDPDWVDTGELPPVVLPQGTGSHIANPHVAEPLLALAVNQERNPEDWRLLDVWEMDIGNPWLTAYAGALGWLPADPSPALLEAARFRANLRFEELLNLRRSLVPEPGIDDLLERLQMAAHITPVQLSLAFLDRFPVQTTYQLLKADAIFPEPNSTAERHGRNIVVVYKPGSVEDLCLLWNLRASHGQPTDLPLGLPATEDVAELISKLQATFARQGAGAFSVARLALTSLSVPREDLIQLAKGRFPVVDPQQLLRTWKRPARITTDVATFQEGRARLSAWAPSDRDRIGGHETPSRGGGLVAHLEVQPQPLPPFKQLVEPGGWPFPDGYRHSGWEEKANDANELLEMRWPSGWRVLEWCAQRHHLKVRPSPAGLAAAALLRRLGGLESMNMLLSPSLIATLERLCERKGISWFRQQARNLAATAAEATEHHEATLHVIEEHLAALRLRPAEDEARELTQGQVRHLLGSGPVASRWLEWAEDAGVLIRGVGLRCSNCGDRYWRALAEAIPPVSCRGCGKSIARPFPADRLEFRYRASEVVAQSVSFDTLVHLLAMRWFQFFFRSGSGESSGLYGMYPGVEVLETGEDRVVGEADLLLVLSDGTLIPGECKRNGAGLNQVEVNKLESLSQRLGSPWSFVATADRAGRCSQLWRDTNRRLPEPPRFALTAEHIFDPTPFSSLGVDPFVWKEETDAAWKAREAVFAGSVVEVADYLSRVDYLDRHLNG